MQHKRPKVDQLWDVFDAYHAENIPKLKMMKVMFLQLIHFQIHLARK